ncbi:hypothetical protein SAMN06296386_12020 [Lachnospiraceae bacterium]|nr:hypothetical protein SAMN06296386_12020 [Lachnospiraceae bacterium]
MNTDKIKVLENFISELNDETNDLCIFCRDYFDGDAMSSYDSDTIEDPDTDDFGADEYKYLTKSGAKAACKRALKKMTEYIKNEYEKTMKDVVSEMSSYLLNEIPEYLENVKDFIEIFSDDLSYCTIEEMTIEDAEIKKVIFEKKEQYFGELLDQEKVIADMETELDRRIKWALSAFKPKIPAELIDLDNLLDLCEYDYDEDDKRHDYEIDEACDTVVERIEELIEAKAENLFNGAAAACLDLVENYADRIKDSLFNLYTDIAETETGKALSDEEKESFRKKNLCLPDYDDEPDDEEAQPDKKTWIIYPWDLLD